MQIESESFLPENGMEDIGHTLASSEDHILISMKLFCAPSFEPMTVDYATTCIGSNLGNAKNGASYMNG